MRKKTAALTAAALIGWAGPAVSATIIELRGTDAGQPIRNDIEINGDRALVTVYDGDQSTEVQFYAETDTAFVIQHEEKTYLELTEESIDQIGAQVRNMVAQIQAQMDQASAGTSEEQRQAIGAMLEQMGLGGSAGQEVAVPEAVFSPGERATATSGIPCTRGTLLVQGAPAAALCVASRDDIGVPVDDYATLFDLVRFGSRVAGKLSSLFPGAAAPVPSFDIDSLDGLPVEMSDADMQLAVTALRQEPRPPIVLPQGYTRQLNPFAFQ